MVAGKVIKMLPLRTHWGASAMSLTWDQTAWVRDPRAATIGGLSAAAIIGVSVWLAQPDACQTLANDMFPAVAKAATTEPPGAIDVSLLDATNAQTAADAIPDPVPCTEPEPGVIVTCEQLNQIRRDLKAEALAKPKREAEQRAREVEQAKQHRDQLRRRVTLACRAGVKPEGWILQAR